MKNLRLWARGLVGAVVGGAANTVSVMIVDPTAFNVTTGAKNVATVAAVSAVVSGALYLKQHPVPGV